MQLGTDIDQLLKRNQDPSTPYIAGAGRTSIAASREEDRGDYSDAHFDNWSGYQDSLYTNADFSKEDEEAEQIYKNIDEYMDGRRKKHREKRIVKEIEKARKETPTIRTLFQDLKRGLSKVTKEEWEAIPDIPDKTIKKKKYDRKVPIPDNILLSALKDMESKQSIDPIRIIII